MKSSEVRTQLGAGDRRSVGGATTVAKLLTTDPSFFDATIKLLSDEDPVIRMRAADALEKASRIRPQLLSLYRDQLMQLVGDPQQELRWHAFQMISRVQLSPDQRGYVFDQAFSSLENASRIVAAEALSAMFRLSEHDPDLRCRAVQAARIACEHIAPSVRARARRMLRENG